MSAKRDLARENEIRRDATKSRNADKVMIGYIKTIHPTVYREAQKYLQGLIAENPGKKDPTKTNGFRRMMETKASSETHLAKNKIIKMDRMRLQIELNDFGETSNPTAQATSNPTAQATSNPTAQTEVTEVVATSNPLAEAATAVGPVGEPLSLMDNETLEQIMADLREDPTIATFFSDFEHQLDNCPMW